MSKGIIKAEDLPLRESIYLKKDMFGYRIVHPIKNEDGTINWISLLFGRKRNLINLIIILLVMGLLFYSYYHDVKSMKDVVENPCNYCAGYAKLYQGPGPEGFNETLFRLTGELKGGIENG